MHWSDCCTGSRFLQNEVTFFAAILFKNLGATPRLWPVNFKLTRCSGVVMLSARSKVLMMSLGKRAEKVQYLGAMI